MRKASCVDAAWVFFYMVFAGGGAWSVDRAILEQE
jgi:hypothetical protein